MTVYYSQYWKAWIAQFIERSTGDLRTFVSPSRDRAINNALTAMFN